jgi:hypothetical protein
MMMKWIKAAVVCYDGTVALLHVGQRSLQYFPERRGTAPQAVGLPEAEEAVLDTADGDNSVQVSSSSSAFASFRSSVSNHR